MTAPTAAEVGESDRKTIVARVADELEALSRVLGSNRAPLVRNGVEVIRTLESQLLAARTDADRFRVIAEGSLDVYAPDSPHDGRDGWKVASIVAAGRGSTLGEAVDAYRAALAATPEEK